MLLAGLTQSEDFETLARDFVYIRVIDLLPNLVLPMHTKYITCIVLVTLSLSCPHRCILLLHHPTVPPASDTRQQYFSTF